MRRQSRATDSTRTSHQNKLAAAEMSEPAAQPNGSRPTRLRLLRTAGRRGEPRPPTTNAGTWCAARAAAPGRTAGRGGRRGHAPTRWRPLSPTAAASRQPGSMQIASQPSEAAAQVVLPGSGRAAMAACIGRQANIVKAEIAGKGTFWRVRVPARSRATTAISLCESYKAAGGNCFVSPLSVDAFAQASSTARLRPRRFHVRGPTRSSSG